MSLFFNYLFWVWTWNYLLKYIAVCLMYFNTVHIQIHFHEIVYTIVWRSSFKRPHNVSCWVMSRPILFKKCSWKLKCLRPYLEFRMKVSLYLAILSYFLCWFMIVSWRLSEHIKKSVHLFRHCNENTHRFAPKSRTQTKQNEEKLHEHFDVIVQAFGIKSSWKAIKVRMKLEFQ